MRTLKKFGRDLSVLLVVTVLGFLLDNWTGVVGGVNETLPFDIPAFYLAIAFSGAMAAYRALRGDPVDPTKG